MQVISKKITGFAVRKAGEKQEGVAKNTFIDDADRRLRIVGCPIPPTASLRWQKRPKMVGGNPGYTYIVDSPEGKFSVFVGHVENGTVLTGTPFEVWVNGEEAPRGLSDLARSLSIDMRSEDRAWLRRKLEALMKTKGGAFVLTMPDGREVAVKFAVEAFARLLLHRCEELGAFTDDNMTATPVVDALMSKREPKTTGMPNMSPYWDVFNHATGDEFIITLKEAELESGQIRPFSVWLSGTYPASLDGLAKSLSLDMRVGEPAWLARKLNQLIDVVEKRGDFFAPVPGASDGKQNSYPSTVAYIAALIQFRFKQVGLFNDEGVPAIDSGVVHLDEVREAKKASQARKGRDCDGCGSVGTTIRMDGCDTCTECAASSCG